MGILKSKSRIILLIIVLIQFTVIGYFAYTDQVSSITTTRNVSAIVEVDGKRYLMVQKITEPKLYELSQDIRFINHDGNEVHLFDRDKQYVETFEFDSSLKEYQEVTREGISYTETNLSCKNSTCMIKKELDGDSQVNIQVFATSDADFIYLDADNF